VRRPVALLLILAGSLGCRRGGDTGEEEGEAPPVPVGCEAARGAEAKGTIALRGVVSAPPDRDAVVAAAVAGRLASVQVREGDRVKAGQLLATVDDPSLGAAVGVEDAARAGAAAGLKSADAALARARRLLTKGIAAQREVEEAEARRAAAAAELRAIDARRSGAVRQRDRAHVKSPIDGVVVRLHRHAGELVDGTPATPIAEVADPSHLELRADIPAADLVRVVEGTPVGIRLDAIPGEKLDGAVAFVSPAVDPATSLGVVRASIQQPAGSTLHLALGLAGAIELPVTGRPGGVLVPAVAVRRSPEGAEEVVVCSRKEDALVAEVRPVVVGAHAGDLVEIASGLKAGELVVTQHVLGLEEGAALEIEKTDKREEP
jgi:RND family efflux transporter MFP subunit